eukprot:TRINITY_DN5842_c0_g1_i4.p1 TRINITY_DN5842_c0_g1~~TRINITY_DN5842_c0_g1_i4.p1  ORF type:complete len:1309 (+),score=273.92 TRINITY_DN5842_c0_g1_i4:385-4311(+)
MSIREQAKDNSLRLLTALMTDALSQYDELINPHGRASATKALDFITKSMSANLARRVSNDLDRKTDSQLEGINRSAKTEVAKLTAKLGDSKQAKETIRSKLRQFAQDRATLLTTVRRKHIEPTVDMLSTVAKRSVVVTFPRSDVVHGNSLIGYRFEYNVKESYSYALDKLAGALPKLESGQFYKTKLTVTFTISKTADNKTIFDQLHTTSNGNIDGPTQSDITEAFSKLTYKSYAQYEDTNFIQSGFTILGIEQIKYTLFTAHKAVGGSYQPTPQWVTNGAIENVQNNDDHCLWYAINSYYTQNIPTGNYRTRLGTAFHRKRQNPYDWTGVNFPAQLKDIARFVSNNGNYPISVYTLDAKTIYPAKTFGDLSLGDPINLAFFDGHYAYIKNLHKLVSKTDDSNHTRYVCPNCITSKFPSRDKMLEHYDHCKRNEASRSTLPKPGSKMRFKDHQKMMWSHWCMVSDFESFTLNNEHTAATWAIYLNRIPSNYEGQRLWAYTAPSDDELRQCMANNSESMNRAWERLVLMQYHAAMKTILITIAMHNNSCIAKYKDRMIITPEQQAAFNSATACHYCNATGNLVRHHDHITGHYIAPACSHCNLQMSDRRLHKSIPCYFHNLTGYDSHHIYRMMGYCFTGIDRDSIKDIPQSGDRSMMISYRIKTGETYTNSKGMVKDALTPEVRYLDSMRILTATGESLDSLIKAQAGPSFDINRLPLMRQHLNPILCRKGIFPYEWFTTPDCLKHTALPHINDFHSKLTGSISQDKYQHAINVWHECSMNSFRHYHDAYLLADIYGLADVLNEFSSNMYKHYTLDPIQSITSPGLAFTAMLKKTGVELDLLSDNDMYMYFERQKRGGFTCAVKREAFSDDEHKIIYVDMNNLYGWSMMQKLPVSDFQWVPINTQLSLEQQHGWIMSLNPDGEWGYSIEVSLTYPDNLHDLHYDFPLAPVPRTVDPSQYSAYQRSWVEKHQKPTTKLIADFMDRNEQVYHIKYLQLLLKHGLKLKAVHRIMAFRQSAWLEPYIRLNTELRQASTTDTESNLFKLMNNAVFGKTMEDVRNRTSTKIVDLDEDKLVKAQSSSLFNMRRVDLGQMCIMSMKRRETELNKPIYAGASILDLSKYRMSWWFYEVLVPELGRENVELLYTDTDSYVIRIKTTDLTADYAKLIHTFDTSNFPKDHQLYSSQLKKVPGYMKSETAEHYITHFVANRAKTYHYETSDSHSDSKAKGCPSAITKSFTVDDYQAVISSKQGKTVEFHSIKSKAHNISTVHMHRQVLHGFDDKRWICSDGITTLPYGYNGTRFKHLQAEPK